MLTTISTMKTIPVNLICLLLAITFSCGESAKQADIKTPVPQELKIETVSDKSKLEAYYQLPHLKEWYTERIQPPAFDYNMDLSKKTAMELRLLKNEIYARNGYLFDAAELRGHFGQFKWYQPVFDVPEFKLYLNAQEQAFIQKVEKLEQAALKTKYVQVGAQKLINTDHVVNLMQFEQVEAPLLKALHDQNFALVKANHEQLFYVYDENQYTYIPNFVTTDLYLQLMHKYLSGQMQEIEQEKLIGIVSQLLKGLYEKSKQDPGASAPTVWANTYLAIAYTTISGKKVAVNPDMAATYALECSNITQSRGMGSDFLNAPFLDYTMFTPRGNYTETEAMKRYFRCIKWLNTAPIASDDAPKFQAALQIAYWIKSDQTLEKNYHTFSEVTNLLAGEEDNVSIGHLIRILDKTGINRIQELAQASVLEKIRNEVNKLDVDRIKPVGSSASLTAEMQAPGILFTAGRYSLDAEIFTKLIHVLRNPSPKRPYPKGLDVFAVTGNETAKSILLDTYGESKNWSSYPDSLQKIRKTIGKNAFAGKNMYSQTMKVIHTLGQPVAKDAPLFMQTKAWQRKNLQTALAAYAELKHDLILYSEQPMAAEAGQGGGPPPPKKISYVEPNTAFWQQATELLNFQKKQLKDLHLLSANTEEINQEMAVLAAFLLRISQKELAGQIVTDEEFERLDWIGGEVERLTFRIMKTDHLPEREKQMALVADVYTYNGSYLETAVGLADEIYVIAEINGLPYLTRGACFSYYEFVSPQRLTDEDWQQQLNAGKAPAAPLWTQSIYIKSKPLKSKPSYSF